MADTEVIPTEFHTFYSNSLPLRPSTVLESSCQVFHNLDGFLLSVYCIRSVPTWVCEVAGGGEDGGFKFKREKRRDVHPITPSYGRLKF